METSLFLAQVIGLYLILEGLVVLFKRKMVLHIFNDMKEHKALMFVTGAMVFILGVLIVLSHNVWEASWRVIPTIIGWIMIVKGIGAFFIPGVLLKWGKGMLKNKNVTILIGLIALLAGMYLVYVGFGLGA